MELGQSSGNYPNTNDTELKSGQNDSPDIARGKSVEDLNSLFQKSENCDRELFAEMRSNILLVSGEHYSKKNNRFWNRLRDSRMLNVEKKLRLTKNHMHRITKIYRNNITKYCPGVKVKPQLDNDRQDQKAAEMNQAVWNFVKKQNNHKREINKYAQDFIDIGECAVKIYFDPSKGYLKGYEPTIDEMTGEPVMENQEMEMLADEMGQPVLDEVGQPITRPIEGSGNPIPDMNKPVFSGKLCHERIHGFNLLRAQEAKTIDESPYLIIRKMMGYNELKRKITDPEIAKKLEKSKDETFLVFDGANGKYEQSKDSVLVREFYFRPCHEYPRGYFYVATKTVTLWEGELPGGVFPIVWEGFDEIQTTPRKRSIVKQLRPYQAEINRASSQAATHQITLGDDKLVVNNSAKVEHGGILPGVRVIKTNSVGVNGGIQVIPGRAGEQFMGYIGQQIDEMYVVANLQEEMQQKSDGSTDIWGSLYGSIRSKKEFSVYTDNFEDFLKNICTTSLELARYHYPDDEVIEMVGKKEQVNMEEFRANKDLGYLIETEPATDDAQSIMGKQMMINHALQYVGKDLGRDDIGRILSESPIGNMSEIFGDFTTDYKNAKNDILQLERGQMPMLNRYENIEYKIKRITGRMKESDFDFLPPEVQEIFNQFVQICEQTEAEKLAAIQRAQQGFIPDTGGLITINGIKDKNGEVLRVPYASIDWLMNKLLEQRSTQQQLESQNQGAVADMSQMITG
tara:strand:- start:1902 stop:4121 length:2220 start_codon:yes stop_codon:yes gene_type:complete